MIGTRLTTAVLASVVGLMAAGEAPAATLVDFGNPWGAISSVKAAMDEAFGAGAWQEEASPTDTHFLANETFVYVEGSDGTTDDMEAFLGAQAGAILDWIRAGGRLFINAAPTRATGSASPACRWTMVPTTAGRAAWPTTHHTPCSTGSTPLSSLVPTSRMAS